MIVLAPATGGPPEILGDARQLYRDEAEAAEKLGRFVRDETLQREWHARALSRRGLFAPERFVAQLRRSLAEAGPCAMQGPAFKVGGSWPSSVSSMSA